MKCPFKEIARAVACAAIKGFVGIHDNDIASDVLSDINDECLQGKCPMWRVVSITGIDAYKTRDGSNTGHAESFGYCGLAGMPARLQQLLGKGY